MYFEDHSNPKLGVAYYHPEPSKSAAEWAEVFGRKTLNAMLANQPIEDIEDYARLAGSYARLAMEDRIERARAFATLRGGHLGAVRP